jgi:hypothetical protein
MYISHGVRDVAAKQNGGVDTVLGHGVAEKGMTEMRQVWWARWRDLLAGS